MSENDTPENNNVWADLPTETEIYILPSGEVVVADLPAELALALASLTSQTQAIETAATTDQNRSPNQSHVAD
jgi:hypothetical protein